MPATLRKPENLLLILSGILFLVIFPALNRFAPEDGFLHVSDFSINLWGKYLCYAVLAISVNLLWGYTGLLCLGQCLFFTLGGYALGMHLKLKISEGLPDFMIFMGYPELPAHWAPFHHFGFATLMVFLAPGVMAGIFGWLAFRSRIKGVYFSILTQALTYAAALLFFRNEFTFGGNNGLAGFKTMAGADLNSPVTRLWLYFSTAALLMAALLFSKWMLGTKYGKVQRAIRDSENRVLFSGYATANFKLFIFVVCAMMAGAAGALYVPQVGIINPGEMQPEKGLEIVVWVAVGGRATLLGPVYGAIFVNMLKSWASREYPDYWPIILGALFVLVVLFAPKGIAGIPEQIRGIRETLRRRKAPADEPAAPAAAA